MTTRKHAESREFSAWWVPVVEEASFGFKPGREMMQSANVGPMQTEEVTFSFGQNWQRFVTEHLNPQREQIAASSLCDFLELPDLRCRSFMDIGCGSGLFSLAAHRLEASKVISFDVDPFSVRCCEELKRRVDKSANWQVLHGSVLDRAFLESLGEADVVYAWGSLHHTGDMWQAIRNAANRVDRDGLFYLSIYNKVEGRKGSLFWRDIKRLYNRSPKPGKRLLEMAHVLRRGILPRIASLENPAKFFSSYHRARGMSYWTDVRDWLGGYPYEFASAHEVFLFCSRELGLSLRNLRVTNTLGTNEFLFQRRD